MAHPGTNGQDWAARAEALARAKGYRSVRDAVGQLLATGISQAEAARQLGISRTTVGNYARGLQGTRTDCMAEAEQRAQAMGYADLKAALTELIDTEGSALRVAQKLGVGEGSVYAWMERLAVVRPGKRGQRLRQVWAERNLTPGPSPKKGREDRGVGEGLPELVMRGPAWVAILPGEWWCCRCGESTTQDEGGRCPFCGGRLVQAASVLRAGEYVVRG
jgi:transposase